MIWRFLGFVIHEKKKRHFFVTPLYMSPEEYCIARNRTCNIYIVKEMPLQRTMYADMYLNACTCKLQLITRQIKKSCN